MKYKCICQSCNYINEKWNGEHCAGCSEGSNFVPIGQEEEDPYQTDMDDAWRQSIKQEDYSDTCKRLGEVIRQEPCDDATLKDIFCMGCEYREQEPKTDWIPVSERLPELNRPLLVTVYHRVCYAHLISEHGNYGYPVFRLHEMKDSDRVWVQETISHEPYSKGRIDAWMYLDVPEPYKAESEE